MAKIKHNSSIDTINELLKETIQRGITHVETDLENFQGRQVVINNNKFINFGNLGYLGLDQDERLKKKSIEYINEYGTQFPMARGYLTSGILKNLESYLSRMFDDKPVILYNTTSTAHISIIPTIVEHEDCVIMDQQVHMSVQNGVQMLQQKGVDIDMIRHNNLEMLERKLKSVHQKYRKVWYMADGVYSMFGDVVPLKELLELQKKYENLYIYVDDSHGMSWDGKNGTGYAYSRAPETDRIIWVNSLSKSFASMGGVAVFPDTEMRDKIKTFGGPLAYSFPYPPSVIGASIASAEIHLSDEVNILQNEVKQRINYCNQLLKDKGFVNPSNNDVPVFFIGLSRPKVTYNLTERLMKEGFIVNPAMFPVVPMKYTGIRFAVTRHLMMDDIKNLIDAFEHHYPKAMKEENLSVNDIVKAFKGINSKVLKEESQIVNEKSNSISETFKLYEYNSIKEVDKELWNDLMMDKGLYDYDNLLLFEESFKDNDEPENNWDFYYFIVKDSNNTPVFATFLTSSIIKDDMLAREEVSKEIEQYRKDNPYYLTSKTLSMGTPMGESDHFYLDRENPNWKEALIVFVNRVLQLQDETNANNITLRDFDPDEEIEKLFKEEGFVKIDMPNTNRITNLNFHDVDSLLKSVSARNRRHIRNEAIKLEDHFDVEYKTSPDSEELEKYYELYLNVKGNNFSINMFDLPIKFLQSISDDENWEFLVLRLKSKNGNLNNQIVGVIWCYSKLNDYVPLFVGLDYNYLKEYNLYKQIVFQVAKRAAMLNKKKVYFGFTADTEKRKYGAKQLPRVAFQRIKDDFNLNVIDMQEKMVKV